MNRRTLLGNSRKTAAVSSTPPDRSFAEFIFCLAACIRALCALKDRRGCCFRRLGAAPWAYSESGFSFPPDFMWGAATAAHQVNSDLWLLEHLPNSMFKEPSGDACDQYHLYEDDIAMLADLGLNAYRFSLNWPRIEPAMGEFSLAEFRHYWRVLEACHRHRITPLVTFGHVTAPQWFAYCDDGEIDDSVPLIW